MLNDPTTTTDKSFIGSWPLEEKRKKPLKTKSKEIMTKDQIDLKKILSEKVQPPKNDVMHGAPYKPPQFHEPRPGAMNFMKVGSVGYRC